MVESDVHRGGPVQIVATVDTAKTVSQVDCESQILAEANTLVKVS